MIYYWQNFVRSVILLSKATFCDFYFVSDSSEVINLLFFSHLSSQIFICKCYWPYFSTVCFTSQIWYDNFLFRKFIWFPDFFLDFSGFSLNLQISSQNGWFTSHIWYDDFLFQKFIRFLHFFWIFADFHHIFRFIFLFWFTLFTK